MTNSANGEPGRAASGQPPGGDTDRRPRTGGEVAGARPIQIALALLVLFLVLLVLFVLWPLLSGA